MASVGWTQRAKDDLQAVYLYIARDSRFRAESFVLRVERAVEQLALFPESGRFVAGIRRSDLRELVVQSYRVIYRVRSGDVELLAVRHSARRLRELDLPPENS